MNQLNNRPSPTITLRLSVHTGRDHIKNITEAWNQGIDAHLEAITDSKATNCGSVAQFDLTQRDAMVLLRRLIEADKNRTAEVVLKAISAPEVSEMTRHYLMAALWTSNDDDEDPLEDNYTISDFAPAALVEANEDCFLFYGMAQHLIKKHNLTDEQVGHDFWLTRNHHGAGFRDRRLGPDGDELADLAQTFPERNCWVTDRKQVAFDI